MWRSQHEGICSIFFLLMRIEDCMPSFFSLSAMVEGVLPCFCCYRAKLKATIFCQRSLESFHPFRQGGVWLPRINWTSFILFYKEVADPLAKKPKVCPQPVDQRTPIPPLPPRRRVASKDQLDLWTLKLKKPQDCVQPSSPPPEKKAWTMGRLESRSPGKIGWLRADQLRRQHGVVAGQNRFRTLHFL